MKGDSRNNLLPIFYIISTCQNNSEAYKYNLSHLTDEETEAQKSKINPQWIKKVYK